MTAYMIKQNVMRPSPGEGEGWRQLRFCHSQKFSFPPHHLLNAPPLNIQSPKCVNFSKWNGVTPGRTAGFQGGNQEWRRQRNEDANEGMIFYFSPPRPPPWSSQFEQSAWDEMRWNLAGALEGPRSHYRRIGFGVRQLRLQIRRTKPQGFGGSIAMRRAINFIICLQMRCTLLPSLGCVCVFVCRWGVGRCHCVRNIKPCTFSLWSDVTDITKKKSDETTGEELKQFETEEQRLWLKASGHESEAAVAKTRIRRIEALNSSKKWQDYSPVFQVN